MWTRLVRAYLRSHSGSDHHITAAVVVIGGPVVWAVIWTSGHKRHLVHSTNTTLSGEWFISLLLKK